MKKIFILFKKIPIGFWLVTLIYLSVHFLMYPYYNFAMGDDFAYAQTVQRIVEKGIFKLPDWSSASLVFQLIWASIFTKIFGFSLSHLHLSVVTIFYFGILSFYFLLKALKLSEKRAIIFTLLFLGNPWIILWSYNFKTNITYLAVLIPMLLFYSLGILKNKNLYLLIGSVFASFAFLTRQIGLISVIAVFLVFIFDSFLQRKLKLKKILSATLLPIFSLLVLNYYLSIGENRPTSNVIYFTGIINNIKTLLPSIYKINGTNNRFYQVFLFYRNTYYFSQIMILTLPVFLILGLNLRKLSKFLKKNLKSIILIFFTLSLFFSFQSLYEGKLFWPWQWSFWVPREITNPNRILPVGNWTYFLRNLVIISLPAWSILIAFLFKKTLLLYFTKRKRTLLILRKILISILVLTTLFFVFIIKTPFIKEKHPKELFLFIQESWTVVGFWFFLFLSIIILFTAYRIKSKYTKRNLTILFLILSFLGNYGVLLISYQTWAEYIINLLPFIYLCFALLFQKIAFSKLRTVIIISFMLIFSIQIAKETTINTGVPWEEAMKIVESGVKPELVYIENWAWRPWFFYEETWKEAIEKEGRGNKYKVYNQSSWTNRNYPSPLYKIGKGPCRDIKVFDPNLKKEIILNKVIAKRIVSMFFSKKTFCTTKSQPLNSY